MILAYDATALLVEIGSCLGLWLGLSIVGVYDLIARVAFRQIEFLDGYPLWLTILNSMFNPYHTGINWLTSNKKFGN